MESLLLVITYETGPIEKKMLGCTRKKRRNHNCRDRTHMGDNNYWWDRTLGTQKLLDRVKVAERLRYELEQRFLFQKKNPGVKWDPLEVTLSTRPGRSDIVGDADPARTTHITILVDDRLTDRVEHEVLPGRD